MERVRKREVQIGKVRIGGDNPIAVQTMLNVPAGDVAARGKSVRYSGKPVTVKL